MLCTKVKFIRKISISAWQQFNFKQFSASPSQGLTRSFAAWISYTWALWQTKNRSSAVGPAGRLGYSDNNLTFHFSMEHGDFQFSSCPYPIPNSRKGMGVGKEKKPPTIWLWRSIPLRILAGAQIELSVGIQHSLLNSRLLWPYEGQHPADSKQCLGHTKLRDCHEELNGLLHHCRENNCVSAVLPQFPLERPLKQIHRSTGLTASSTSI